MQSSEKITLARAHAAAAAYANRRGPMIRVVSRLFSREHRRAAYAMYAFFRTADDLIDEDRIPLEQFRAWRAQSQLPAEQQTDPLMLAWSDIRTLYNIPLEYERALLDGLELDLTCYRYHTMDELKRYCYGASVAPFLLTMSIIGFRPGVSLEQAKPYMEKLGTAIQMTDILWDIRADLAAGRIYLPQDELAAFGLSFADIEAQNEAQRSDDRTLQFMRHFADIVREHYIAGWPMLDFFPNNLRLPMGLGITSYRAMLDDIEARDFAFGEIKSQGRRLLGVLATKWPAIFQTKSADKYFQPVRRSTLKSKNPLPD